MWQLEPERRFAAVNFDSVESLLRYEDYPHRVCIGYGVVPPAAGITRIHYDTARRIATILE